MNEPTELRKWMAAMRLGVAGAALALVAILVTAVFTGSAQAQTFTLLYTFTGGADGGDPIGGLIMDPQGNLYGTTAEGGNPACLHGCGTVFKLDPAGNETVLYSFTGTGMDGSFPSATLVRDLQGNLYGTTQIGGTLGFGTVFKVGPTGAETILYSFTRAADGGGPVFGALIMDDQGNLYGTTAEGGDLACNGGRGCGTVFKVNTTGKETVLYSFTGTGGDGAMPFGGLVRDAQGNLYGTTGAGGQYGGPYGFGTVFKIDTTGKETVLHSFNLTDGYDPEAGLAFDARGNLYGTTRLSSGRGPDALNGVVFRLSKTYKESVLHRFGRPKDGYGPTAGVVRDAQGNLYGTTASGARWNCGTVFKVDKTGKETLLYVFTGGSDGASPYAGLVQDTQGNLYGTTTGSFGTGGTVFKIAP
jgi:uncharacterized repeat protein (TIGR03803 family)